MISIVLPFPPSVNHTWMRGKGQRLYANPKVKTFHNQANAIIKSLCLLEPLKYRLKVKIVLNEKDRRKRDIDNYTKSIFDACTKNGVWEDDSQVDELIIVRGVIDKENPRVTVNIFRLECD